MRIVLWMAFVSLLFTACHHDTFTDPADDTLDNRLISALNNAAVNGDYEHFILPEENYLAGIPQPDYNPLTFAKIKLGRNLFYESCFSTSPAYDVSEATYSCSSCHLPTAGFMPGRVQGIADGGFGYGINGEGRDKRDNYEEWEMDVQGIRPLNLVNVAFFKNTSWNGQFGAGNVNEGTEDQWGVGDTNTVLNHLGCEGLEAQNIAGIDLHRMEYTKEAIIESGYLEKFDEAFPDLPEDIRYGDLAASFALSSYLRSLLTTRAPFQEYLRGDTDALTERQKEGALLFFDKAGCYRCHNEPNLGSTRFYAVGADDLTDNGGFNTDEMDKKNFGRGAFTGKHEDKYKFRIPQLYNLKDAAFLFHGSSKSSVREVVEYFNLGIPENERVPESYITGLFTPLNLTDSEVDAITDFIENGLYDAEMDRHVPNSLISGNCFPNNDPDSRADLGCE